MFFSSYLLAWLKDKMTTDALQETMQFCFCYSPGKKARLPLHERMILRFAFLQQPKNETWKPVMALAKMTDTDQPLVEAEAK